MQTWQLLADWSENRPQWRWSWGNHNVLETQLNKWHYPVSICISTKLFSYLQILLLFDEACGLYNYIWPSFTSIIGNENILPIAIEHKTWNYIIMCDLMYFFSHFIFFFYSFTIFHVTHFQSKSAPIPRLYVSPPYFQIHSQTKDTILLCLNLAHTPSLTFCHLALYSAITGYVIEGALLISARLSTDAVSALRKIWIPILVIRLWK